MTTKNTDTTEKRLLIRRFDDRIREERETLKKGLPLLRAIHESLSEIGIDAGLADIKRLFQRYQQNEHTGLKSKVVADFVTDAFVARASGANFNGVPISNEKLRTLIKVPDTAMVTAALEGYMYRSGTQNRQLLVEIFSYMALPDGKVSTVDGADDLIVQKHSHYTTTEKGAEMLALLGDIASKFNRMRELDPQQASLISGFKALETDAKGNFIPGLIYVQSYDNPPRQHNPLSRNIMTPPAVWS